MPILFNRRHYVLIASILSDIDRDYVSRKDVVYEFAKRLKGTNPKFDVERFIDAAMGDTSDEVGGT